jgi:hypothetical protein
MLADREGGDHAAAVTPPSYLLTDQAHNLYYKNIRMPSTKGNPEHGADKIVATELRRKEKSHASQTIYCLVQE